MPVSFVVTGPIRVPLVSLTRTTVAPGTTPPCESFTVPDTLPVVIWAETDSAAPSSNSSVADTTRTHAFITHHLRRRQRPDGLLCRSTHYRCIWGKPGRCNMADKGCQREVRPRQ